MRVRAAVLAITLGCALTGAGPVALGWAAEDQELYGCDRTVGRPPTGNLAKSIEPRPGTVVEPGDVVSVTLTWRTEDWSRDKLHKVLDCVTVDGEPAPELEGGESPTENDGRFSHEFAVPADAAPGSQLCDQAMLSGPGGDQAFERQYSERLCLVVGEPVTGAPGERAAPAPAPPGNAPVSSPPGPPAASPPGPSSGTSPDTAPPPHSVTSPPPPAADTPPSEAAPHLDEGTAEREGVSLTPPTPAPIPVVGSSSPSQVPELPRTGGDMTLILVAAAALAVGGALLLARPWGGRPRREPS